LRDKDRVNRLHGEGEGRDKEGESREEEKEIGELGGGSKRGESQNGFAFN